MKDKKVRKPRKNSKGLLKKNTGYKTILRELYAI